MVINNRIFHKPSQTLIDEKSQITLFLSDSVIALECYECTASSNSDPCGDDDFSSEHTTTTVEGFPPEPCKYCYKAKAEVEGTSCLFKGTAWYYVLRHPST